MLKHIMRNVYGIFRTINFLKNFVAERIKKRYRISFLPSSLILHKVVLEIAGEKKETNLRVNFP